jgi:hypothetical protein
MAHASKAMEAGPLADVAFLIAYDQGDRQAMTITERPGRHKPHPADLDALQKGVDQGS